MNLYAESTQKICSGIRDAGLKTVPDPSVATVISSAKLNMEL